MLVRDIVDGAEICRDFVEGPESLDPLNREALLNVWRHSDMTDHDWRQVEPPIDFFQVDFESLFFIFKD